MPGAFVSRLSNDFRINHVQEELRVPSSAAPLISHRRPDCYGKARIGIENRNTEHFKSSLARGSSLHWLAHFQKHTADLPISRSSIEKLSAGTMLVLIKTGISGQDSRSSSSEPTHVLSPGALGRHQK
jgi:hypothetical protein